MTLGRARAAGSDQRDESTQMPTSVLVPMRSNSPVLDTFAGEGKKQIVDFLKSKPTVMTLFFSVDYKQHCCRVCNIKRAVARDEADRCQFCSSAPVPRRFCLSARSPAGSRRNEEQEAPSPRLCGSHERCGMALEPVGAES